MWLLRGVVGIFCVTIAAVFLAASFERPYMLSFTFVFAGLAMWVMKFVSRFSPKKARIENALEELKIRNSASFGLRNRLMGLLAIAIGCSGVCLNMMDQGMYAPPKVLLGGITFIALGFWYAIKGAKAEKDDCYRAVIDEVLASEVNADKKEAMISAIQKSTHLPRKRIEADVDREIKKTEEQFRERLQPLNTLLESKEPFTAEKLHDAEQAIEQLKKEMKSDGPTRGASKP